MKVVQREEVVKTIQRVKGEGGEGGEGGDDGKCTQVHISVPVQQSTQVICTTVTLAMLDTKPE